LDFIDAPSGKPEQNLDKLYDFKKLLGDNPSTTALIVVLWMTNDLQSILLSTTQILHLIQSPEHLPQLTQITKPLSEVLNAIMAQQTKYWKTNLEKTPCGATKSTETHSVFGQSMGSVINVQPDHSYQTERKLATLQLPIGEEKKQLFFVWKNLLDGIGVQELVPQLTYHI
jgi:hypothetical protein